MPRGTMRFGMDLQPRFDYARAKHKTELSEHGAVLSSDDMRLTVHVAAGGADRQEERQRACSGTATASAPPGRCAKASRPAS